MTSLSTTFTHECRFHRFFARFLCHRLCIVLGTMMADQNEEKTKKQEGDSIMVAALLV